MMDSSLQSTFLSQVRGRLTNSCERAQKLVGQLNRGQIAWKPNPEQWSVGQCLDHVSLGAELYATRMEAAIARERDRRVAASIDIQPRHTFWGRQIIRAVEPTAKRKMKAPKIFAPSTTAISEDPLGHFVAVHEIIAKLAADCDGLDVNRIKMSSPVAWFIRINLADAFEILASHAERHLAQAERVRDATDFPA